MKIARVQGYRNRQALVKICFIIIVFIFIYRAFTISSINANDSSLKLKASNNSEFTMFEKPIRGSILDRNNNLLAINLIQMRVNLDPMIIQDEYLTALAEALMIPKEEFRETIKNKRNNKRKYYIAKKNLKVTDSILKNIAKLKQKKQWLSVCEIKVIAPSKSLIDKAKLLVGLNAQIKDTIKKEKCGKKIIAGVAVEPSGFRYYPKKDSLAPLLGKTNSKNNGVFGIESEYDQYLTGVAGISRLTDNKSDSNVYYDSKVIKKFKKGVDLNLTIDSDIQFHVYNAIKEQAEFH